MVWEQDIHVVWELSIHGNRANGLGIGQMAWKQGSSYQMPQLLERAKLHWKGYQAIVIQVQGMKLQSTQLSRY